HTASAWGQLGAATPAVRRQASVVRGMIAAMAVLGAGVLSLALRARTVNPAGPSISDRSASAPVPMVAASAPPDVHLVTPSPASTSKIEEQLSPIMPSPIRVPVARAPRPIQESARRPNAESQPRPTDQGPHSGQGGSQKSDDWGF